MPVCNHHSKSTIYGLHFMISASLVNQILETVPDYNGGVEREYHII